MISVILIRWIVIYSVDSAIQRLNNPGQDKIVKILRIERDGISAIKFEAARIHFLSDVFVAVTFVIA